MTTPHLMRELVVWWAYLTPPIVCGWIRIGGARRARGR